MESFGLFTPQPLPAPYLIDLTPERTRFTLRRAPITLPAADVADLKVTQKDCVEVNTEITRLSRGALQNQVEAQIAAVSERYFRGQASFDELREIRVPSQADVAAEIVSLTELIKGPIAKARPAVLRVHAAVIKGVAALRKQMEVPEKESAAEWGLPFEPSPQLKLVISVGMWLERVTPPAVYSENEGVPSPAGSLHYMDANFAV